MAIYKPEFVSQAEKLCKFMGATNEELAAYFGVTKRTIINWMEEHEDFGAAVTTGKDAADLEVVAKLFHRATGYSHPETDIKMFNGEIIKTEVIKHYPPDTVACIFWLTNRQRKDWRRKPTEESHADIDRAIKELDRAKKELEVEALKKSSAEPAPVTKIEIEVVGGNARASSQNTDD